MVERKIGAEVIHSSVEEWVSIPRLAQSLISSTTVCSFEAPLLPCLRIQNTPWTLPLGNSSLRRLRPAKHAIRRPKILFGGGKVVPVAVQGNCSYSVYAGPELEFVVQFRLKSLMLRSEIAALAREIYGFLAPSASFHGELGDDDSKEPLFVYVMDRVRGISHLDFVLANGFPENSDHDFIWRKTLMADVAQYGSPSGRSVVWPLSEYDYHGSLNHIKGAPWR